MGSQKLQNIMNALSGIIARLIQKDSVIRASNIINRTNTLLVLFYFFKNICYNYYIERKKILIMKDYYKELNTALSSYENFEPYHQRTIDWICHRIDWCWKWKKISEDEMVELSNRAVNILDQGR